MSVSRVARNIGSGYAGAAVNGIVLLVLTPLVVRHLSPSAYGIWVLTTAIGSYLGFLNAGSGAAGVRAVARLARTGRIGEASRDIGSIFRIHLAASIGGHLTRWLAIRKVAPQIHLTGGPEWRGFSADVSIFSALSFGYESLRTLFDNADLLLLGILAGPAAVAVFSVGVTLASFVSKGLQPISGVLFPMASEMEALGQRSGSARLLEVGTRVNLALALPLVTILLVDGPTLLRLWVGEGFAQSYPVLAAFALAY